MATEEANSLSSGRLTTKCSQIGNKYLFGLGTNSYELMMGLLFFHFVLF